MYEEGAVHEHAGSALQSDGRSDGDNKSSVREHPACGKAKHVVAKRRAVENDSKVPLA